MVSHWLWKLLLAFVICCTYLIWVREIDMGIEFSGKYALNGNGGVNFQAKCDGKLIVCRVSSEALQDIAPDSRQDGEVQQIFR